MCFLRGQTRTRVDRDVSRNIPWGLDAASAVAIPYSVREATMYGRLREAVRLFRLSLWARGGGAWADNSRPGIRSTWIILVDDEAADVAEQEQSDVVKEWMRRGIDQRREGG